MNSRPDPREPSEAELNSSDSPLMTKIVVPMAVLGLMISLAMACAGEYGHYLW